MSARVDSDSQGALVTATTQFGNAPAVAPLGFDNDDQFGGPALPSDHPAWLKDAVSLSQRARALVAKLKPVVVNVVGVWEHRLRSIVVGGRKMTVDPSGSYRMD